MALIPPSFLDCVVAIGVSTAGVNGVSTTQWIGTGFIFGENIQNYKLPNAKGEELNTSPKQNTAPVQDRYFTYWVTNKHVIQGHDSVVVRLSSTSKGTYVDEHFPLQDKGSAFWFAHPNDKIDIAAIPFGGDRFKADGMLPCIFTSSVSLTRDEAVKKGLSEGDSVFTLGFPVGVSGISDFKRNFVVVRQGAIARIRDWFLRDANDFLIDSFVFPGNSGSPVILRPEMSAIAGTQPINQAYLIGFVGAYLPYRDIAISASTLRERMISEENSGLAKVIPADFVVETVAHARAQILKGWLAETQKNSTSSSLVH